MHRLAESYKPSVEVLGAVASGVGWLFQTTDKPVDCSGIRRTGLCLMDWTVNVPIELGLHELWFLPWFGEGSGGLLPVFDPYRPGRRPLRPVP